MCSDVDVVTVQDPTKFLYRDSDVEGMSDGFDDETNYGGIYGVDEPSMGWSRYAQGFRHMALNSGLFYLRASERTIDLMRRIADRLHKVSPRSFKGNVALFGVLYHPSCLSQGGGSQFI